MVKPVVWYKTSHMELAIALLSNTAADTPHSACHQSPRSIHIAQRLERAGGEQQRKTSSLGAINRRGLALGKFVSLQYVSQDFSKVEFDDVCCPNTVKDDPTIKPVAINDTFARIVVNSQPDLVVTLTNITPRPNSS